MGLLKSSKNWALALAAFVLFQPILIDTARAQGSKSGDSPVGHLAGSESISSHVERVVVSNHWALHVTVRSKEGMGECTIDAKTVRYGDGYTLTYDAEVNDATELLMKVKATGPDGAMKVGAIRLNRLKNEGSTTGMNDVALLLSTSRHARLIRVALPEAVDQMRGKSGRWTPVVNAGAECGLLIAALFVAVDGAVAVCAIPEPVEPFACSAAVGAVGIAAGMMANAGCTGDVDNTIGWG